MDIFEKELQLEDHEFPASIDGDDAFSNFETYQVGVALAGGIPNMINLIGAKKRQANAGNQAYILLTTNYPPGDSIDSIGNAQKSVSQWKSDRENDLKNEKKKFPPRPQYQEKYKAEISAAENVVADYEDIKNQVKQAIADAKTAQETQQKEDDAKKKKDAQDAADAAKKAKEAQDAALQQGGGVGGGTAIDPATGQPIPAVGGYPAGDIYGPTTQAPAAPGMDMNKILLIGGLAVAGIVVVIMVMRPRAQVK